MRESNNSDPQKSPTPQATPKRRGRPKGSKDTKPRKNAKPDKAEKAKIKKLLKPEITTEPIFPKPGEKGTIQGKRKTRPRPLPPGITVSTGDLTDTPILDPKNLFSTAPEVSDHADWRAATPIERRFCYEYFASGFRLVDSFRTIAGELGDGLPEDVLRRAKMYVNRSPVVKALKVLVDFFLQDRKLAYAPKILSVLEAQAFYDPADIVDGEGGLRKNLHELEPHLRWCIKGIETKYFGKDADRCVTTVVLVDRTTALEKLSRYVALFDDSAKTIVNVQNNTVNNVNHALPEESRSRLSKVFEAAAQLRVPVRVPAEK